MDSLRHQEANTKMYVEDLMAGKKKKKKHTNIQLKCTTSLKSFTKAKTTSCEHSRRKCQKHNLHYYPRGVVSNLRALLLVRLHLPACPGSCGFATA